MAQKVLSDETYRIGWDLKGFKKEDIGEEEFNDLTKRYLKIYDEWTQYSNEADVFDKLNQEYIFDCRKSFDDESLEKIYTQIICACH